MNKINQISGMNMALKLQINNFEKFNLIELAFIRNTYLLSSLEVMHQ